MMGAFSMGLQETLIKMMQKEAPSALTGASLGSIVGGTSGYNDPHNPHNVLNTAEESIGGGIKGMGLGVGAGLTAGQISKVMEGGPGKLKHLLGLGAGLGTLGGIAKSYTNPFQRSDISDYASSGLEGGAIGSSMLGGGALAHKLLSGTKNPYIRTLGTIGGGLTSGVAGNLGIQKIKEYIDGMGQQGHTPQQYYQQYGGY